MKTPTLCQKIIAVLNQISEEHEIWMGDECALIERRASTSQPAAPTLHETLGRNENSGSTRWSNDMTDAEITLLHLIAERFKNKAWSGSPTSFIKFVKCEGALGIIKNPHFRSILHGWGVALWFSRSDSLIRCVDTTIKKLPKFIWGPGQCAFCGMFEEYPEFDLTPDIDNGERIEGQNVHKFCQQSLMRLRGKLRLIERRKQEAKLI